ncbi:PucR family transcriptional regulator [Kineococcus rhizosphaerae]|uniref:CdaR family transcriptional regulator n=1 Tax=Kineococcus rhizosphaerae TaxID=559628 RepID=A0A2T0RAE3_9ACTN|nr:helix-turn-helix domain-containing protein [Kineococcus rhizosphaerae]PRY18129.1 CdaR family transcriptional regulator [Kineococcus rhizosphaerae]
MPPTTPADADPLPAVAAAAAADAGGLDPALLGDFLDDVWQAVLQRRRLSTARIARYRAVGERAAGAGVALRALLDLYLSAAWRLWRHLPPVVAAAEDPEGVVTAGEVVLRATDDAVAVLSEAYQLARRQLIRREESDRREFVDDLLAGTADLSALLRRAPRYGLELTSPHAVAVVRADVPFVDATAQLTAVERRLQGASADADPLVATKDGALVVVFAAPDRAAVGEVLDRLRDVLGAPGRSGWRVGVGRPAAGAGGVVGSYEQARGALALGDRLGGGPVADAADLLVYEVLLRDRAVATDLVETTLGGLRDVRGGAEPVLRTLEAYLASGGNATEAARRLHLSVRAVTYRLARVRDLTGVDVTRPEQRFGVQAAVLAARALGWPDTTTR